MKKYLFITVLIALCTAAKCPYLHPYSMRSINLHEPSDICLTTSDPSHYYIVSNRGCVGETDSTGKVLRHSKYDGNDYEGVCVKDGMIYALDESARRVDMIDETTLEVVKSFTLHFGGPRNKSFEGLTYIPSQKKFIAVIEKPAMVFEYNEQFEEIDRRSPKEFTELSSVTYHDNYLWFLSDENHNVSKVDPVTYKVVQQFMLPVNNPEGICFDANGNLLILSDDMEMLFKFKMQ